MSYEMDQWEAAGRPEKTDDRLPEIEVLLNEFESAVRIHQSCDETPRCGCATNVATKRAAIREAIEKKTCKAKPGSCGCACHR